MSSSENSNPHLLVDEQYAWVEAATPDEVKSQKQILLNLEALKIEMDTANKSSKDLHQTVDSKITMVNESISTLLVELKKNNSLLEDQAKIKRLELASTRTHLWSFKYYNHNLSTCGNEGDSADLVRKIINSFLFGAGYTVQEDIFFVNRTRTEKEDLFREKIVFQLTNLVGKEPRLEINSNGTFTVFYE